MKKLKNLCLSVLINEGEEVNVPLSPEDVKKVEDVKFNKGEDYVKITFSTNYGKNMDLLVKVDAFNGWISQNKDKYKDVFRQFVIDFLSSSAPTEEGSLNEIIDDDGNIMPDEDMPNNSTNTMVVGPKFDLEKIYRSFVPKSIRFYSGDLGIGVITW
jgi:hypothetical protein